MCRRTGGAGCMRHLECSDRSMSSNSPDRWDRWVLCTRSKHCCSRVRSTLCSAGPQGAERHASKPPSRATPHRRRLPAARRGVAVARFSNCFPMEATRNFPLSAALAFMPIPVPPVPVVTMSELQVPVGAGCRPMIRGAAASQRWGGRGRAFSKWGQEDANAASLNLMLAWQFAVCAACAELGDSPVERGGSENSLPAEGKCATDKFRPSNSLNCN